MESQTASFGARLRQLRDASGLSQLTLAKLISYHQSLISKVETGAEIPSAGFARTVDKALGANGELIALLLSPLTVEEEERLLGAARRPTRTDATVIDSLAASLAAQRRLDDALGSTPLLQTVSSQLALVECLAADVRGPIRPRLVSIAAQWAQFAGWLCTSAGYPDNARRFFAHSLEWAEETSDRDMVATALSFRGHAAWLAGQPGPTIGLSAAARRDTSVYAGQRAYDAQQEARGHAMTGDRQTAERLCGQAEDLATSNGAQLDHAPPWQYYRSEAFYRLERGLVYRLLGRDTPQYNQRAVDLISSGLAGLPADQSGAEWAGEYLYHQAAAHLQDGDQASAHEAVGRIEEIATATSARPLMRKAKALRGQLAG